MWDEMFAVAKRLDAALPATPTYNDAKQVRPGQQLPLFTLRSGEHLGLETAIWGYVAPWNNKLVYNTRIESAGNAMWADSFTQGRSVVAVNSFFEPHATQTWRNPATGRMTKLPYEFRNPSGAPLLLGAVCQNGRTSIVTTEPNASVAPIHHRMPLVLAFEEVPTWLGLNWHALADRSSIVLEATPEHAENAPTQPSLF